MPFKRILAAIDFSEPITEKVIKTSVELASSLKAELYIMNVVEKEIPMLMARGFIVPSADVKVIEKVIDRVTEEAKRRLNQMANELAQKHSISVVPVVEMGMPFERIIKKAEELEVDLIVVGSHGKTGIEKLLLGSVSEKVARKAETNVLIVRADKD